MKSFFMTFGFAAIGFAASVTLIPTVAMAQRHDSPTVIRVVCENNRVTRHIRARNQQSVGPFACMLGEFTAMSQAERFASQNFGGFGARCSCG
jgi:hypothetical protein